MYPNPNNGNFNIQQTVADSRNVNVEIWDAIGAKVYVTTLNFDGSKAAMKVANLSNGTYLLRLYDSSGYQYTIKFTIMQ